MVWQMHNNEQESPVRTYAAVALVIASVAIMAYTFYASDLLAINYGVAAGATAQAESTSENVSSALVYVVSELSNLYRALRETYALLVIAAFLMALGVAMFATKAYRTGSARKYAAWHMASTLIFLLFFIVIFDYFAYKGIGTNLEIATYATVALAAAIDLYFLSNREKHTASRAKTIELEPMLPYANIIRLREAVFESLSGNVGIVDKHFNSQAIENLYRLISNNESIKKLAIITHTEALDSGFSKNYNDFKKELFGKGIETEVMIMSDADAKTQHERFIFDERSAFKIPPLNIINEKSEHITRIRISDAKSRFMELMKNTIKYENYLLKKSREKEKEKPQATE
ncbi:MAG: hypothetical protein QXT43_01840 [Candidatus Micrarchaeaceae archaeon]